jgi:dTDP-4-dehydrorhamnose reductase
MAQTISVVGASSFIGSRLFATLKREFPPFADCIVTGTHFSRPVVDGTERLDLTCRESLRTFLLQRRPDTLILVAGTKDVGRCEQDYDYAYRLNTAPVEILCDCIKEHGLATRMLYVSSDYVFSGTRGRYRSGEPPSPITNYGRTKMLAEQRLQQGDVSASIVRTAAVMGLNGGFLRWLVDQLRTRDSVTLLDNSFFSPTPVELLADRILAMIAGGMQNAEHVVHAVGPRRMSRYTFGVLVLEMLRETGLHIQTSTLEREFLPKMLDLSLSPSVFPGNSADEQLEAYLHRELESCLD